METLTFKSPTKCTESFNDQMYFSEPARSPIIFVKEGVYESVLVKSFTITTHPTDDSDYQEALSTGKLKCPNRICDIYADHKLFIFNAFEEDIVDLRKNDIKFCCVIDISDFPKIQAYLDIDSKLPGKDKDLFGNSLSIMWNNYSSNHIITVTVNTCNSHIDVQLLPFNSAGSKKKLTVTAPVAEQSRVFQGNIMPGFLQGEFIDFSSLLS